MRILVISYAFPPFNSIGGLRVSKTAKYLLEFGHDVRVVTARDQPFRPTLPLEVPPENVIYSRGLNVRKPAEVVLRGGARAAEENRRSRGGRLGAALKRALGFPLRTLVYFPDANIGWAPYAIAAASRLIEGWRPDAILASSPPPTSLLVAHRLSKKFDIPWVADLRDLWVDHHYYSQPSWRKAAEQMLERRVLSSASGLVTVSGPLAEKLKSKYGRQAAVVLNGFDPADYAHPSGDGPRGGVVRILYTGVTYPGRQDPSPLFAAMRQLGPLAENVRVSFYGSYLGAIREAADRHGVGHLVEVNTPVPYKEALRLQAEADVLLLLLWTDPAERGVYTGKLFEYVGARRPILAVGGEGSVAAEFVRDRRAGVVLDEPSRIAEQLRVWIRQKREEGAIPCTPPETASGVSREEQVRVLESYLQRVLQQPGAAGPLGELTAPTV